MPWQFLQDPDHWHYRAEEARRLAAELRDPIAQQLLLRIAEDYERLAQRAEELAEER
jgi:hypothetical protein